MEHKNTGFRQKALNSAKLSTLNFVSEALIRLISTLVLTRLLAPEIYGIFAVVLVYMYLLEMFSDFGIRALVLTKEDPIEDDFLFTCWTVAILRGCAIWGLSAILALVIWVLQINGVFAADNAYAAITLPWAIAALGSAPFIKGFLSSNMFMAQRGMMFGRVTLLQIFANVTALVVTISLAYSFQSIWALVIGSMTRSAIEASFSFLLFSGPKMRLSLSRENLLVVYDRGKWIMLHSILTALSQSADRLFLGLILSSASFGHYAIASQIIGLFKRFMLSLNSQMGLQVFSHILKSSTEDFRKNYYKYRRIYDAFGGVFAGGLLVSSPMIVDILFDDRYQSVAPYISILGLGLLVLSPLVLRSAFSAERQFKQMTVMSVVTVVSIWGSMAISIFVFDSVIAAVVCVALHRLPEAILLWIRGMKRGWVSLRHEFMPLVFLPVGAALGWLVVTLKDAVF